MNILSRDQKSKSLILIFLRCLWRIGNSEGQKSVTRAMEGGGLIGYRRDVKKLCNDSRESAAPYQKISISQVLLDESANLYTLAGINRRVRGHQS